MTLLKTCQKWFLWLFFVGFSSYFSENPMICMLFLLNLSQDLLCDCIFFHLLFVIFESLWNFLLYGVLGSSSSISLILSFDSEAFQWVYHFTKQVFHFCYFCWKFFHSILISSWVLLAVLSIVSELFEHLHVLIKVLIRDLSERWLVRPTIFI